METDINKKYSHIAFISYKREDEKWAKWLQQKLENYRLPVAIHEQHPDRPQRLRPVFRDTTDLSGGVLVEAIKEGLESSRHLIVICSPRAANSEWVCKEVEDFIKLGRQRNIIPFIIEGEPHSSDPLKECFPKSLLKLSDEEELIGHNVNEVGREAAFIKVVSTLLDIKFDTLWQRFQRAERRRRRMIVGGLLGFIILLTSAIISISWQYAELNKRNTLIENQNKEIEEKNDSIIQINHYLVDANKTIRIANDSIERAYRKLSISEQNLLIRTYELEKANARIIEEQRITNIALAKAVAERANDQIKEGNALASILALLEVMPDNSHNSTKPYVAEAEAAIRLALDSVSTNRKRHILSEDKSDIFYRFSKTNRYIYRLGSSGEDGSRFTYLFVYDANNFQMLGYNSWRSIDIEKIYENENDEYIVIEQCNDGTIRKYDLPSMKETKVVFRFEKQAKDILEQVQVYDAGYSVIRPYLEGLKCVTNDGLKTLEINDGRGVIVSSVNARNSYMVPGDLVQMAVNNRFAGKDNLLNSGRFLLDCNGFEVYFHDNKDYFPDWTYHENGEYISLYGSIYDKYILLGVDGEDGETKTRVVEITSGVCVCDDINKYVGIEETSNPKDFTTYPFPSYSDLIKQCKEVVKGMSLTDSARKTFFLEKKK